jgi:hypothetical protein
MERTFKFYELISKIKISNAADSKITKAFGDAIKQINK